MQGLFGHALPYEARGGLKSDMRAPRWNRALATPQKLPNFPKFCTDDSPGELDVRAAIPNFVCHIQYSVSGFGRVLKKCTTEYE